ncbi:MAG: hypothetical protein AABZ60_12785 [Planctomycetota bacterium]
MNCKKAYKWILLSDELDGSQQEILMTHVRSCSKCAAEWKLLQHFQQQFKEIRKTQTIAPLSPDFLENLQQQIHFQTVFYRQRSLNPQLIWVPAQTFLHIAAAILILAGVIHAIPPLLNFSLPQSSSAITSHGLWSLPILKKKPAPETKHQTTFIPYQKDSSEIHEELQRRKSQYFIQETPNQNWTQQIPYFSTPMIYSEEISTDF